MPKTGLGVIAVPSQKKPSLSGLGQKLQACLQPMTIPSMGSTAACLGASSGHEACRWAIDCK